MNTLLNLGFYLLVIGAGVSVAIQQALNTHLRNEIGSAWWAGFASYLVGTLMMLTIAMTAKGPRLLEILSTRATPISWFGGVFGAIFIGTAILMIPRFGVATVLALIVVGQMIGGLSIDHFGLFGMPLHHVSPARLLGTALLVAGVIMVRM
jgi:bacterial/archaeal transporter family-2 protein